MPEVPTQKDYCKKYGLRPLPPSCVPTCSDAVLKPKASHKRRHQEGCRGPHADHNAGFYDPLTKERVGVEQPYFGEPPATLEQIVQDVEVFAAERGLTVRVSTEESWHYPGRTVLIEYRKNNKV